MAQHALIGNRLPLVYRRPPSKPLVQLSQMLQVTLHASAVYLKPLLSADVNLAASCIAPALTGASEFWVLCRHCAGRWAPTVPIRAGPGAGSCSRHHTCASTNHCHYDCSNHICSNISPSQHDCTLHHCCAGCHHGHTRNKHCSPHNLHCCAHAFTTSTNIDALHSPSHCCSHHCSAIHLNW